MSTDKAKEVMLLALIKCVNLHVRRLESAFALCFCADACKM